MIFEVGERVHIALSEGVVIQRRSSWVGRTKKTAREIRRYVVELPCGERRLFAEKHLLPIEEGEK